MTVEMGIFKYKCLVKELKQKHSNEVVKTLTAQINYLQHNYVVF